MLSGSLFVLVLVVLCGSATALPQEIKIRKSDLPSAVRNRVDQQSKDAIVRAFTKENENGQTKVESLTKRGELVAYEA